MTMPPPPQSPREPDRDARDLPGEPRKPRGKEGADRISRPASLKLAVGGLALVLVGGAVVIGKSLARPGAPARAAAQTHGPAARTDAGMDAAAQLSQQGRFNEAAALLERIIEKSPTDQGARVAFAQALIGQKKYKAAYEQYEAAIALLDPSVSGAKAGASGAAALSRDPAAAQLQFEAGTCANLAELPSRAQEHYWMAQSLDAGEAKYPLYLAMVQIKAGDEPAANVSLLRAVKMRPDLAEAWGTLAELALKQNRLGLAEQHIAEARRLQPETLRWRVGEARVLNRKHEAEKGAALLLSLRADQRRDKAVMSVLGESYGLMGKPQNAAAMYVQAAGANPKDAELAYNAALWLDRAGEPNKAANFARTAAMEGHAGAKDLLAKLGGQVSGARD